MPADAPATPGRTPCAVTRNSRATAGRNLRATAPAPRHSLTRSLFALILAASLTPLAACSTPWDSALSTHLTGVKSQFAAVSGQFGEEPQIAKGEGPAPTADFSKITVLQGKGEKVEKDYFVVVDYKVQTWTGTPVSSSFSIGNSAVGIPLIGEKLPQPWANALIGQTVGSRIELVISAKQAAQIADGQATHPADASSTDAGQPTGQATKQAAVQDQPLVYVIDIRAAGNLKSHSALSEQNSRRIDSNYKKLPVGLRITGAINEKPQIELAADFPEINRPQVLMLWQGKVPNLKATDFPLVRISSRAYENGVWSQEDSTWDQNIAYATLGTVRSSEVFLGVPVGSRMLQLIPAQPQTQGGPAQPARIVIYDVVGAVNSAR